MSYEFKARKRTAKAIEAYIGMEMALQLPRY
jgi:hypothetical protein